MTPPLPGYSDWQTPGVWRAGLSINAIVNLTPNTDLAFGGGVLSNFAGVSVSLIGMNQVAQCYINYGEAIPIVGEYRRNAFTFPAGSSSIQLPIDGLAFQVHLFNANLATNLTGTVKARVTNNVGAHPQYYTPNCFVSNPVQVVAAGGNVVASMPGLMPGPAQFRINSSDLTAAAIVVIGRYNPDGSQGDIIAEFSPIPNGENNVVYLPEHAIYIKLINNSAANITFGYALYPAGGLY